ncbi:MAG TPA: TSUP family transporter, partial [Flavobacteriales bacterium]|nr:TSUP family transporter [Flavobacteriales bacterium]
VCLLFAVGRLFGLFGGGSGERNTLRLVPALLVGAVLGFVSGVIGIGGGILLSPVLLVFRWADAKETAAVSALFIFVNSASGIVGAFGSGQTLSPDVVGWVAAALVGGLLGGYVGSRRLTEPRLRQVLGVVLLLASVKLMLP